MMDLPAMLNTIHASQLLGQLSQEAQREVMEACTQRRVRAGEVVVAQGSDADGWYLILEGRYQVSVRQGVEGPEKELRVLGVGDHFGEIALLSRGKRTATVKALEDGALAILPAEQFRALLRSSSHLAASLCEALGRHLNQVSLVEAMIPFKRIRDYPEATALRGLLPPKVSQFCRATVLERFGDRVLVAMADAYDADTRSFLAQVLHPLLPDFVNVNEQELARHIGGVTDLPVSGSGELKVLMPGAADWEGFGETETDAFLGSLLERALGTGSSDVHLEAKQEGVTARVRCQGKLVQVEGLDKTFASRLSARLRVMAGVDIHQRWQPQDGTLRLLYAGVPRFVRLALLPCLHGDKAALRILEHGQEDPDELARRFPERWLRSVLEGWLTHPHGLILVTGPTGAGKTTTLYSLLNALHAARPALNVISLEDPVDRDLPFVTQIPVHPASGRSFGSLLRAVLRQDPDVLMVGEIRDPDSAAVCLEAATTGHLVIASLHTGSALESVTRLQTLGIGRFLIADAIVGVISQVLLPAVCRLCAAPITDPAGDRAVGELTSRGLAPADPAVLRRGAGCDLCQGTGSQGLAAAVELWTPSAETRRRLSSGDPVEVLTGTLGSDEYVPRSLHLKQLLAAGRVSPDAV